MFRQIVVGLVSFASGLRELCCDIDLRTVSSPVVWEGADKKKFRPLSSKLSQHLEDSYAQYLVSLQSDSSARRSRVQQTEHNFEVSSSLNKTVPLTYSG